MDSVTGLDTGNLEELCVRLLGRFHPDGPTSVDIFVSQLPESIAADIPIAADWRVVGARSIREGAAQLCWRQSSTHRTRLLSWLDLSKLHLARPGGRSSSPLIQCTEDSSPPILERAEYSAEMGRAPFFRSAGLVARAWRLTCA